MMSKPVTMSSFPRRRDSEPMVRPHAGCRKGRQMDQAILIGETDAGHVAVQEDLFPEAHPLASVSGGASRSG